MVEAVVCPRCGKSVPTDAPQGFCPACMMHLGLESDVSKHGALLPSAQDAETIAPEERPQAGEETIAPAKAGWRRRRHLPLPALPGQHARYEILNELAAAAWALSKARHNLDCLVALKMILAGSHAGEADRARFRTEAEAIARVKHANIIQIYEIGEHEGKPYFSLEFCTGGSLAQKLNGTPIQPKEAARLVEKLAAWRRHISRTLSIAILNRQRTVTQAARQDHRFRACQEARRRRPNAIRSDGHAELHGPEQASGKTKLIGPPPTSMRWVQSCMNC